MNQALEKDWKEAFVASFKVLSWYLSGGSEYNHEKPSNRTVDVSSKILTWHLPNEGPKCYPLGKLSQTLCACENASTVFFGTEMSTTGAN